MWGNCIVVQLLGDLDFAPALSCGQYVLPLLGCKALGTGVGGRLVPTLQGDSLGWWKGLCPASTIH